MQPLSQFFCKILGVEFIEKIPVEFVAEKLFGLSLATLKRQIKDGNVSLSIHVCDEKQSEFVWIAELEHFINNRRIIAYRRS